jgi:hypothetical protein
MRRPPSESFGTVASDPATPDRKRSKRVKWARKSAPSVQSEEPTVIRAE